MQISLVPFFLVTIAMTQVLLLLSTTNNMCVYMDRRSLYPVGELHLFGFCSHFIYVFFQVFSLFRLMRDMFLGPVPVFQLFLLTG